MYKGAKILNNGLFDLETNISHGSIVVHLVYRFIYWVCTFIGTGEAYIGFGHIVYGMGL